MRESRGSRDARDARESREPREPRGPLESRGDTQPGETATMRVPPRNRWQVLLVEYELLDAYWSQLAQRMWMSGLFLVGLSMIGIGFLAPILDAGEEESLRLIGLIGGVASLLTVGWWLLLRRLFTAQRVAEYRRNEIERELGMRSSLYLTFLRQARHFGSRRASTLARQMAEGDEDLEAGLREFATSAEGRPWMPRFLTERLVWSLVPWLLIAAWAGLYWLKT